MGPWLLLAISSNLDDLSVSFSFGLKDGQIPLKRIIIIAVISGLTMYSGLMIGEVITNYLTEGFEKYLSTAVFAGFAIWFLYQGLTKNKNTVQEITKKYMFQEKMTAGSAFFLGLILGIDSLFLGFSGGLSGYPVMATTIAAFLTSFCFVWLGSHLGERLSTLAGNYANYLAALLLFIIALIEFI